MLPTNLLLQNRYRIVRLIGQGGMGAVYEAVDQRLAHTVALKQITRGDATAFEREARLLARLRHPALPSVTDHFVDDIGQFLVMDFIPGDDLAKVWLQRKAPFTLEEVLAWGDQLLTVLEYLHTQTPPVIHRDIKPANLKLTDQGQLILLDFGLAKGKSGETSEPQKSAAGYTLCYAAPEQIRSEGTDARSDLYSVAATVYHLLTGTRPPDAIQRAVTVAGGQPDPLFSPQHAATALSPVLTTILQKAMAFNPAERFGDAATFRLALRSAGPAEATQPLLAPVQLVATPLSPPIPNNLPARLTSLVGRDAEITALRQLLARPDVRLITLTGAGGSGKTSLAVAVARALCNDTAQPAFPDGIYFVNLAPIYDHALIASTIAQVLEVKEEVGQPLLTSLQEQLRARQTLLVLDNFEQIVAAAPMISELLTTCAGMKIIVTSREVLRIRGEHEYSVPLLAFPKPDGAHTATALATYAAVQLFVQRAQAIKPNFILDDTNATTVAEICMRLDGLPLAIELAAARIKVLSPQHILQRLSTSTGGRFHLLRSGARDMDDRQRTLYDAIRWSYELLNEADQALFRSLAIFVDSFSLEAAEAVFGNNNNRTIDVLDGLSSLVDKSLLRQIEQVADEPRFTMLETIREYGVATLVETGEFEATRYAHAEYYLAFVQTAETHFFSDALNDWLDRVQAELGNIRAVLAWGKNEEKATAHALQIAGLLWRFWTIRGHCTEGFEWLDALLVKGRHLSAATRHFALHTAGHLALDQGNHVKAREFYEECLTASQAIGNAHVAAHMHNSLGNLIFREGDYRLATEFYKTAYQSHWERNRKWPAAISLSNLGTVAHIQGNFAEAKSYYQESLSIFQSLGERQQTADRLCDLGRLAQDEANYQEAGQLFEAALALFRQLDDKRGVAAALVGQSEVARWHGDYQQAATMLQESLSLLQPINNKVGIADLHYQAGKVAFAQGAYGEAHTHYQESFAIHRRSGDQRLMALIAEAFATVAIAEQKITQGIRLFSAAAALRQRLGTPLAPAEQADYTRLVATGHDILGEAICAITWAEGQTMTPEQAIEEALSERTGA